MEHKFKSGDVPGGASPFFCSWGSDGRNRQEFFVVVVVIFQPTLADVHPQTMHRQFPRFQTVGHEGECQQIFQRRDNCVLFKLLDLHLRVRLICDQIIFGAQNVHPAADKAGFFFQLGGFALTHV